MSLIEVGSAFAEGVILIASPCILPVLPLVLSASADGGKKRPFGIIAGFVLSFSIFALVSRSLIEALHIDVNVIKTVSLWLLFLFGLVLVSSKMSEVFSRLTQRAAAFGNNVGQTGKDGFFSGMAIGSLIGLVWTPCAGPILAVVLVQVIKQQTNLSALFIIMSFAIGAGLPMLAIALVGRSLLGKVSFFTKHTEEVRRAFGIIIILAVGYIAFSANIDQVFTTANTTPPQTVTASAAAQAAALQLDDGLAQPYPAPDFAGLQGWINSKPLTMAELKGKVVLVDFWTYSCINCVRTLPYLVAWDKKYRDQGLVIVGIHSPEFEFEKEAENVKAAVGARGIKYPVALDNNLTTWTNFKNEYWPAHYLINRDGQVVYTHFGEGKYDVTENNIRYLLGLKGTATTTAPQDVPAGAGLTPETYLGYGRGANYVGKNELQHDVSAVYQPAATVALHHWTLWGLWRVESEKIVAVDNNAVLQLRFMAKKVFLVMGTTDGKPVKVSLKLDGAPIGKNGGKNVHGNTVTVTRHTIYELVSLPASKNALLEITAQQPGVEIYAFTFGG